MYGSFFGFTSRPFSSVPQTCEYYPAETIESTRQTIVRCIERGEGAAMIVGPSGTGKTLLCGLLAEHFRYVFATATLSSGRLSSRSALLQAILYALDQPYRGMDEGELRLALVDHLITSEECPNGMLLLVDEAHTLPLRLLDEIRMLTNIIGGGIPRVRLVLAGGSSLEERFASPKLDSFNQRVVARCYLEAFDRTETQEYVRAQMGRASGLDPLIGESPAGIPPCRIFTEEACRAIYQTTDGIPRLINQVGDHALVLAYANGLEEIDSGQIEEAWADLQQLPTPFSGESTESSTTDVVEFGGLDDAPLEDAPLEDAPLEDAPLEDASLEDTASTTDSSEEVTAEKTTAEEDSTPALRISPDSEPVEQLQQIEDLVAEASEDFQPAGTIRPEVELVFDEPTKPFREEFKEEEIVNERSCRPATNTPAQSEPTDNTELADEEEAFLALCNESESDVEPEDKRESTGAAAPHPVVPTPRPQYSRLFAGLRRG